MFRGKDYKTSLKGHFSGCRAWLGTRVTLLNKFLHPRYPVEESQALSPIR